jgi:hypothetical protein
MVSQRKKQRLVTVVLYVVLYILLSACGGTTPTPDVPPTPYRPFLALFVCGDNTLSYPQEFLQEAMRNLADKINASVVPNSGGMFVDINLVEASSLQDTFVSFSTQAIPNIPPKPQPGNDPYRFAKQLRFWKKTVALVNALISSVRQSINPSLDKMRSIHLQEVGGTDEFGCAASAADVFSHFPNANKVLLYISDMQNNIATQFSKHINLYGAKVRTIYRVCEVESACEQNDAYWAKQFKAWGASSYEAFSPAQSSAEKITF